MIKRIDLTNMRNLSILLGCAITFSVITQGCFCKTKHHHLEWNHYATAFCTPDEITFEVNREDPHLIIAYPRAYIAQRVEITINSTQSDLQKVAMIAKSFGDDCLREVYDEKVEHCPSTGPVIGLPGFPNNRGFLSKQIVDMEVTSNLTWSPDLPAGTSLKSQFYGLAITYGKYAQTCDKRPIQKLPINLDKAGSDGLIKVANKMIKYQNQEQTSEVHFDTLDKLLLEDMTYLGGYNSGTKATREEQVKHPCFDMIYLASPHPQAMAPQVLTFTITFKDGSTITSQLYVHAIA